MLSHKPSFFIDNSIRWILLSLFVCKVERSFKSKKVLVKFEINYFSIASMSILWYYFEELDELILNMYNTNNKEKSWMEVLIFTKKLNFDQLFHIVTEIVTELFLPKKKAYRSKFKKTKINSCEKHGNTWVIKTYNAVR